MPKLYAGFIYCQKPGDGHRVRPVYCVAVSMEEAIGKGSVMANERWPAEQGFIAHHAEFTEVQSDIEFYEAPLVAIAKAHKGS